jgi:hypothetical protein
MIGSRSTLIVLAAGALALPAGVAAQTPAHDPSSTLDQVLPPSVVQQVLATIADARSRGLPAAALEHRALELNAKGMPHADIPNAIAGVENAMGAGQAALAAGGRAQASDAEVEAAGAAEANGVDGATISGLAQSAPSGRSLAVPLAVLTALVDRGLPADDALARVIAKLEARASDQELAALPDQADNGLGHKPATTGQTLAATKRPTWAGPPGATPAGTTPAGIAPPANGGAGARPTMPTHPTGRP